MASDWHTLKRDIRLIDDFVAVLEGKTLSVVCTALADSIYRYLIGFLTAKAMNERWIIEFQ